MPLTYTNPVWSGYFADPFVLRVDGVYYAYGTGDALEREPDGPHVFTVLRSRDLATWESLGAALVPPESAGPRAFWAPEVATVGGRYFLYYSSAPIDRDEQHRLRVATATDPAGPFEDAGLMFPDRDEFSIDAHPFCDPRDGRWYLFYATDIFEHRTGTGLAVRPLAADMVSPAGPAQVVLQANADWQIYERDRWLYERRWDAWHTVEGPCVVAHDGRYYCFYSGGNWQTHDYGVSYAAADHPLGPWTHATEEGPVVLRERTGEVLGPGHNSHVIGPDGRTEFLVYHAWDPARTSRRMCLDPLVWTPEGPRCLGPTTSPQPLRESVRKSISSR